MAVQALASASTVAEPTRAMVEKALAWHLRLCETDAGDAVRQACAQWCAEHPAHALAYARIESLWSRFDDLEAAPSLAALNAGLSAGKRLSRQLALGGAVLGVLCAVTLALANLVYGGYSPAVLLADHRTGAGEQKTVALADGSSMILNSRSAVDVDYSGSERRIVLRSGEVLVDVAKDAARPFVIASLHGTARALGTRYLVRQDDEAAVVTVLESVVRTCAVQEEMACTDLHAGQQASISAAGVSSVRRVDASAAASWHSGSLLVDDRPLAEVLEEIARHRSGLLRFDAQAFAGHRVSGVFPLRDTDKALEAIAATQPVTVKRYTPWLVMVEPR